MPGDRLDLFFPQWQGAGGKNDLFHGALALGHFCPDAQRVTVKENGELKVRNGILGHEPILDQMKTARRIIRDLAPRTILTVGGDCGVEVMPVSYLNQLHQGRFTLIWLDAHADLNTPETSPSGHFHGMPLATLLGLGDPDLCGQAFSVLAPDQVILAGLRNPDPIEMALVNQITVVEAAAMEKDPGSLTRAVQNKGFPAVYIHLDLDVLDPLFFPHVGIPEPNGLSRAALTRILKDLKTGFQPAGLGLTEYAPAHEDPDSLAYVRSLMDLFR